MCKHTWPIKLILILIWQFHFTSNSASKNRVTTCKRQTSNQVWGCCVSQLQRVPVSQHFRKIIHFNFHVAYRIHFDSKFTVSIFFFLWSFLGLPRLQFDQNYKIKNSNILKYYYIKYYYILWCNLFLWWHAEFISSHYSSVQSHMIIGAPESFLLIINVESRKHLVFPCTGVDTMADWWQLTQGGSKVRR